MEETMLDVDQTAKKLGVQPSTVRHYVFRGLIPFVRMGRKIRFRPSVIAEIQKNGLKPWHKEG